MTHDELKQLFPGIKFRSYSGRAMYGQRCPAMSGDGGPFQILADLLTACLEEIDDQELLLKLPRLVGSTRMDQMGRGVILYWPSIEWDENLDAC